MGFELCQEECEMSKKRSWTALYPGNVASNRVLISVPAKMHADMKVAAEKQGVSMSEFVRDALAQALVLSARPTAR
jgi:predicted HicB family RNase H-like nuclease